MEAVSTEKARKILGYMKPPAEPWAEVPGEKITVHAAVSRVAVFYETLRNAIDYKDEHLLRKAALLRILKRRLAFSDDPKNIALYLIKELIAARYLPNGAVPEMLVDVTAQIIQKFQVLRKTGVGDERYFRWLIGLVGAEIEEALDERAHERGLSVFLYEALEDKITLKKNAALDDVERRLQIYVACLRLFLKADDDVVSYKLVRAYYSSWMRPEEWTDARAMALQMLGVERQVRHQLKHRFGQKFQAAVKPAAVALRLLVEALKKKPELAEKMLKNIESELYPIVEAVADERLGAAKGKLRRGTVRAVIYLFITKMALALCLEVPFETLLYKELDMTALAINISFPPVLMFIIGAMIRMPGPENVAKIKKLVSQLLSDSGLDSRDIKVPARKSWWRRLILQIVYVCTFGLTFGLVFSGLKRLNFTPVSSAIFIFFLCVVSFFAYRLRQTAREFVVVEKPERFSTALGDLFFYPILRAGQFLSSSISRINIFLFFFDFLVEAPFKLFLNALETWFAYMREKKEELQ